MKASLKIILIFLLFTSGFYAQNGGYTLQFDGTDDYVDIPNSGTSVLGDNSNNDSFTIETWFKYGGTGWTVFSKQFDLGGGNNYGYFMEKTGSNKMQVGYGYNGGWERVEGANVIDNNWHHYALIFNNAGTISLYIDGVWQGTSASFTPQHSPATINLRFMNSQHYGGFTSGLLDEFRVWNTIRTEEEIKANMYKELIGNEASLVTYYKMSNGSGSTLTDDHLVTANDGTISGAEWKTSGALTGPRQALDFDGIDDHITFASSPAFNNSAVTVEAWINSTSVAPEEVIVCWGSNGGLNDNVQFRMNEGKLQLGVDVSGWSSVMGNASINTGNWVHVAMVKNNTSVSLYVNGILDATGTIGLNPTVPNFFIGAAYKDGALIANHYFPGRIDEVRVWTSARTESQIRENMMSTLNGNEAGLIGYYRFDHYDGTTLFDYSNSSNNGTLTNMNAATDWVSSSAFNTWIGSESSAWSTAANWSRSSIPAPTDNVGLYKWGLGNEITISGIPEVNNILFSSAASPTLSSNFTVNGSLILENFINLNGQIITLGSSGYLSEGIYWLYGSSGTIKTTRNLSNLSSVNVAGLGAVITTAANMGSTTITRGHTEQTGNGHESIKRYYDITPTNNSSLNATLVFNYYNTELNLLTEDNFRLYKSVDNGTTWTDQGGTLNAGGNNVTKTGISSFSRWTVADYALPINLPIPAVLAAIEGSALSYTEGSGEVQITNTITVGDADDTNLESAVVQITGNYQSAEDELTFVNQNGITGSWNSSLGKMTLTGSSSLANYQTALRSVKYGNNSQSPNTNERTVSFTVNDGDNNSNTITRNITLTVLASNPTVVINSGGRVNEGGTLILNDEILKAGDEDGPSYSLTYNLTEGPKHGTMSSSFTQNDIANGKVTYIHDASEAPADTFKFVVVDEDGNSSDESTFVITIIGLNDEPVITGVPSFIMNEDEELTITRSSLLNYVSDVEDPDSLLTITLQSATPQLAVTESGNDFILSVTENWFGNASCIFTAGDGKATASGSVNVTVNSVNDLPVLSGLPSSIEFLQTGSATIDLNGTGSDVETADSLLVFSFSADPDSINVSYNNQTGIATITSAGNFTGNATMTVTVTDADGGIVSGTTNVTVTPEVVGIEQLSGIPEQYSLYQNYPNPFNPTTKIKFGLPEASQVSLKIYDMLGREIAVLANSILPTGYYEYNWNATDNASGIYFCVLSTSSNNSASAGYREIRKMLLIK